MGKRVGQNFGIRYSEAFKMATVRELEREDLPYEYIRRKYGIGGSYTVQKWVRKYGNGSRGKIIRVETPEQINELKRLKDRVKRLEALLADASIDLAIERATHSPTIPSSAPRKSDKFKPGLDLKAKSVERGASRRSGFKVLSSEVRGQKSEVRSQRSEVRGRRSAITLWRLQK